MAEFKCIMYFGQVSIGLLSLALWQCNAVCDYFLAYSNMGFVNGDIFFVRDIFLVKLGIYFSYFLPAYSR